MDMQAIAALIQAAGVSTHSGYASTGAVPPYVVVRPMIIDTDVFTIDGGAMNWDFNFGVYCVGASVAASYNLAVLTMQALQGQRVGGSTLACTMGYVGAQVEGRYESQVTVQVNQGALI